MHAIDIPSVCFAVLAHNEERRIACCLFSLLSEAQGAPIHVIVNGSNDRTAEIARAIPASNIVVHVIEEAGKSRNWNRFAFDMGQDFYDVHVFVDGDVEVRQGSVAALVAALSHDPFANVAGAMPLNGRRAERYRSEMRAQRGIFGALYAVRGSFLRRMKDKNIRLPDDLIGDDGLIAAMAKTDLETEANWDDRRVAVCEQAGFSCEPVEILRLPTLLNQYRRMKNYAVRRFQNMIISSIMRDRGPTGLPRNLSTLYGNYLDRMTPRRSLFWWHFDTVALHKMRAAMKGDHA